MAPRDLYQIAFEHLQAGRFAEADEMYRKVIGVAPDHADSLNALGVLAQRAGRGDEAEEYFRRAVAARPQEGSFHHNLALALEQQGRVEEAIEQYRHVITENAEHAPAQLNLGFALASLGRLDEAIEALERGLALKPDVAEAHFVLGSLQRERGEVARAIAHFRKAEALGAGAQAASGLLYSLQFDPLCDARSLLEEHRRWHQAYAVPLADVIEPHTAPSQSERRLRIGYVSSSFRDCAIGRFLLPLLSHHDHVEFEVFCYSDVTREDALTRQLRACADTWRDAANLSDEELSKLIRQDGIDILIDLNKHMDRSRLLAFARKPAPVQATHLGYSGTTGLEAMDYRLTDSTLDPPGGDETCYCERSVRLGPSCWGYGIPFEAPSPGPLPALARGHVTFGCFNQFSKINQAVLEVWSAILRRISGSKLLLHAPEGSHRDHLLDPLRADGIDTTRVTFVARTSFAEYFSQYRAIDIALDPFPYPGGATTCDALWMGVPVITMAGKTAISRVGMSMLSNVGLPTLIALSPGQYLQLAIALASDLPRLAALRASLREQMHRSPLMDAGRFARDIENAYRRMWTEYLVLSPSLSSPASSGRVGP